MSKELVEPVECFEIDGGCGRKRNQTKFHQKVEESILIDTQFIELQEPPENSTWWCSTREDYVHCRA